MAVLYVDDGGDDSDGLTWAKAFNSISNGAIVGVAAGSTIYQGSSSIDNIGATITATFANGTHASPIEIISADITSGEPPVTYQSMADGGGEIQTDGGDDFTLAGNIVVYGLKTDIADNTNLGGNTQLQRYHDCLFESDDRILVLGNDEGCAEFVDCSFNTPNDGIGTSSRGIYIFRNATFTTGGAGHFTAVAENTLLLIEDSDLSAQQTIYNGLTGNQQQVIVRRCLLHANTLTDPINASVIAHPDTWILIESSAPGNNAVPVAGLNLFIGFYGRIDYDAVEYRTGGANDGETPYSWKMVSNATATPRHAALKTPPIVAWLETTDTTIVIHVAHDAEGAGTAFDLLNTECFLEFSRPDETDVTTARGTFETTLPATVLTAAGDLDDDAAAVWQAGGLVEQKITATIDLSDAEAGPVVIRVCLALTTPAGEVWVCPKPDIS